MNTTDKEKNKGACLERCIFIVSFIFLYCNSMLFIMIDIPWNHGIL